MSSTSFVTSVVAITAIGAVVGLGLTIWLFVFTSGAYRVLPPGFRKMEPAMVWLGLIPCFGIVWNFFVYPGLADSYSRCLAAQGRSELGNCGKGIAMGYCVCCAVSIIPLVNFVSAIAALVLLIMFLVKVSGMKKLVIQLSGHRRSSTNHQIQEEP